AWGRAGGRHGPAAGTPPFHKHVEPLLQAHCQKCHQRGGLAPFPLLTYDDASRMSPMLATATQARLMPPWGARDTDECKPRLPWNHDERLSEGEIATFAAWDEAGGPEGDPADPRSEEH